MSYYLPGNLVVLRKRFGYNQTDLGNHMSVAPNTISSWERDNSRPDLIQAQQLALHFKISLDELISFDLGNAAVINMVHERTVDYQKGLTITEKIEIQGIVAEIKAKIGLLEAKLI